MIEPFLSAVPVLKRLENAGFEAYFVGGSVRDFLLSKPIHDVDIATSATPEEMKRIFSKTVDIGIEHGTILVLFDNHSYEITTFRAESDYIGFRKPREVAFIRSLKKDLERRDFTMNAIAMDKNGIIHDPFDGQSAIKAQRIETVGKAEERFKEDALRLMRAVRFVSQLGFKLEGDTLNELSNKAYLLEKIAVERKKSEFDKLLTGSNRRKAIELLIETNMDIYLPGLKDKKEEMKKILIYECDHLQTNEMWSLLLYSLGLSGKSAEHFLRDWRLPLKQIKEIQSILTHLYMKLEQEWTKYRLYSATIHIVESVEKLFNVINENGDQRNLTFWLKKYQELPIKNRSQIDVTGSDLQEWFNQKGGPWIHKMLMKVEEAILEGIVENKKTIIKEWLMKCNQK